MLSILTQCSACCTKVHPHSQDRQHVWPVRKQIPRCSTLVGFSWVSTQLLGGEAHRSIERCASRAWRSSSAIAALWARAMLLVRPRKSVTPCRPSSTTLFANSSSDLACAGEGQWSRLITAARGH